MTDEQKKKIEELQKVVDAKIQKIPTEDQNKQLKDLKDSAGRGLRRELLSIRLTRFSILREVFHVSLLP